LQILEKKKKMVVSAKSLPRGNFGRNFADRGTADLLQAGDNEVIISTVAAGSRAPGQAEDMQRTRWDTTGRRGSRGA
jgi:hypothetical protein